MAKWVWKCNWENQATHWEDSEKCQARSRVVFSTKDKASRGLKEHQNRTDHEFGLDSNNLQYKFGRVYELQTDARWP